LYNRKYDKEKGLPSIIPCIVASWSLPWEEVSNSNVVQIDRTDYRSFLRANWLFAKFYAGLAHRERIYCPSTRQPSFECVTFSRVLAILSRCACNHIYGREKTKKIAVATQTRKSFFFCLGVSMECYVAWRSWRRDILFRNFRALWASFLSLRLMLHKTLNTPTFSF